MKTLTSIYRAALQKFEFNGVDICWIKKPLILATDLVNRLQDSKEWLPLLFDLVDSWEVCEEPGEAWFQQVKFNPGESSAQLQVVGYDGEYRASVDLKAYDVVPIADNPKYPFKLLKDGEPVTALVDNAGRVTIDAVYEGGEYTWCGSYTPIDASVMVPVTQLRFDNYDPSIVNAFITHVLQDYFPNVNGESDYENSSNIQSLE